MIDEIQIFGVYVPAALVWATFAALIAYFARPYVHRLPLQRLNWHPGLLDLALFALFWWGLASLADAHVLPAEIPLR